MSRSTFSGHISILAIPCGLAILLMATPASAQVFTVEAQHVQAHYTHFAPTNVKLPADPITTIDREELIRDLQSDQGFAMRPLPVANLTLRANGPMEPAGEKYAAELNAKGVAAKPGDRVVVTNIKFYNDRIVLDLNNGPEHKHRILRHISMDPYGDTPIVQDSDAPPTGARLTLLFPSRVPDLTGQQVEALLRPMIDFGVKSPAEAYAESLPDFLRKAIEEHRVLIGMDRDMVRYAKGEPIRKIREQENGQTLEIWMYGETPQPVEFVRFVGSFVMRVEVAKVGEPLEVRTGNEMGNFWGNQPVVASSRHEIELGDPTAKDAAEQNARKSPPTLRNPGEKLPNDNDKDGPTVAPVNFPKDTGNSGDAPTVSTQPPSTGDASQAQPPSGSSPPQSGPQWSPQ
jgi:hypothetical protein